MAFIMQTNSLEIGFSWKICQFGLHSDDDDFNFNYLSFKDQGGLFYAYFILFFNINFSVVNIHWYINFKGII